jgi:hypothetical protein
VEEVLDSLRDLRYFVTVCGALHWSSTCLVGLR